MLDDYASALAPPLALSSLAFLIYSPKVDVGRSA